MLPELLESNRVFVDERLVVEAFADDDVHHGECQRGVGPRPDHIHLIRLSRGFALSDIDSNDLGAAFSGVDDMPSGIWLACEVRTPQNHQFRIGA